ncbi:SatD family protein [Microbacterium sp. zg.Y1090]|uniref:SatD family protein n=1 Tax=Microbacterium TaxID=33882 RepID=UPI00214BF92B|nr:MULTISPECIES: SatD family protein [unclassified Microbacterium]MCR2813346.1 SatD family protein [Microbacterium sp. zg.Y1084]MCR2818318.1 SatD family protein [Microbacterium sp. zg.Y1090]MDL5488237.1 SatD family protein [Microbacterium sp. zg-Y1211]WIM27540.1 SatD family protein [Microbacterium sp. zg-Y1090]
MSHAAVIADIVGSRRLPDRATAQAALDAAIARVEADFPLADRPLRPIVGDELQGVYPTLVGATTATLLLRLALPDGIECRFGIGVGPVRDVPSTAVGTISEGPAWWAARAAIDIVHAKQSRALPSSRTWAVAAEGEDAATAQSVRLANAALLTRDQLISAMGERARRITYRRCLGHTQRAIAADEDISQSAVSQALVSSGGAVLVDAVQTLLSP